MGDYARQFRGRNRFSPCHATDGAIDLHETDRKYKAPALAAECDQPIGVADRATSPQETVFKPAALQVILELPLHVGRQTPAIGGQHARLAKVNP